MAISVRFPDGSLREVPSELRSVDPLMPGVQARFRHVPINCDPQWRYVRVGSLWRAQPRRSTLSILIPPTENWWEGIMLMGENPSPSDAKSHRAA